MTTEQKIRNEVNKYEDLFVKKFNYWPNIITVLEDVDGVLKVQVESSVTNQTSIKYLNGDKFHETHEEAFYAEL